MNRRSFLLGTTALAATAGVPSAAVFDARPTPFTFSVFVRGDVPEVHFANADLHSVTTTPAGDGWHRVVVTGSTTDIGRLSAWVNDPIEAGPLGAQVEFGPTPYIRSA